MCEVNIYPSLSYKHAYYMHEVKNVPLLLSGAMYIHSRVKTRPFTRLRRDIPLVYEQLWVHE